MSISIYIRKKIKAFFLSFIELETTNASLRTKLESQHQIQATQTSSQLEDKVVRKLGFYIGDKYANGLHIFLFESGKYGYFSSDNKIKYISKSLLENSKLPHFLTD
jgi:hypothetical protein